MQQQRQFPVQTQAGEILTSAAAPLPNADAPEVPRVEEAIPAGVGVQPVPDEAVLDDQATVAAERLQPTAGATSAPNAHPGANQGAPAYPVNPDAATYQDLPQPPPPSWQPLPGAYQGAYPYAPAKPANVPWQTARSWGPTTFTIDANTAAGASYLFWWVSGLLVYFSERQNRFVRFHAMQSILLTGALTVFGVLASVFSGICADVAVATGQHVFARLSQGVSGLATVIIAMLWLGTMIAAWTGNYLRLPIVGHYAERYAAPPLVAASPDDD